MGAAAVVEVAAVTKKAELPDHVKAWPAMRQLGWLDSQEAVTLFPKGKTRRKLRLRVMEQMAYLERQRASARGEASTRPAPSEGGRDESRLTYPYLYATGRSALFPDRPCACAGCCGKHWPYPHVGSIGPMPWENLSYECYVLRAEIPAEVRGRRTNEAEAVAAGLTIVARRRHGPKPPMVAGCERCGRDRHKGERYCAVCRKAVRREMRRAGYLEPVREPHIRH